MVAALGGVERKGRWIPARQNYAVAVMGGVVLDFREALLPPGVTEVWIFTAMGGCRDHRPSGSHSGVRRGGHPWGISSTRRMRC